MKQPDFFIDDVPVFMSVPDGVAHQTGEIVLVQIEHPDGELESRIFVYCNDGFGERFLMPAPVRKVKLQDIY